MDIVYSRTDSGHKASYAQIFAELLDLTPEFGDGHGRCATVRRLVRADRLLFQTLDDDIPVFVATVLLRRLRGRPTAALFLRPHRCFEGALPVQWIKRALFAAIRRGRLATVCVIVPFAQHPAYARIASDWVHDPEAWDLDLRIDGGGLPETPLSRAMATLAGDRRIVLLPGSFLERKGAALLTALLKNSPELAKQALFFWSGRVGSNAEGLAAAFTEAGGHVVGRYITDAELFSLYGRADAVWACYGPQYDQASGVFGRAVQTGLPVILRRGARLEQMAADTGHVVLALDPADTAEAANTLAQGLTALPPHTVRRIDVAGNTSRRTHFLDRIAKGMTR